VFSGNRNEDWEHEYVNSEVYRVSIETGDVVALTDRNGPDSAPVVSPDGKKIAYLGYEDKIRTYQLTKLHVMNADGSDQRELLAGLDRSVSGLVWNKSSDGIYFQYDDHGDTKIAVTTLAGKMRDVATNLGGTTIGRPYGGGSFSVAPSGQVAYTHVTPYRPAELAIVQRRKSRPTVVTEFNKDLLDWRDLGQVEEIWYKSSVDGRDVQGWVVKPPGYDASNSYPLLVENHGGPISNYGARFSPEIQLYAAAGYIVFYPNPRGSTGYGEEFGDLLYNNYPGDDYQDVMDGKTRRFRAAAVIKPIMNWMSKTLTADNYYGYANYRYPGQPWENMQGYMKFSPISLVGNVDSEAKQLYNALKIRGIDTALVEVPGAPHNIAGRPSQLITKVDHILAWFEKYATVE